MPFPRKPDVGTFYAIERGSTSKVRRWVQDGNGDSPGGSWAGVRIFATRAAANVFKRKGDFVCKFDVPEPAPAKSPANR